MKKFICLLLVFFCVNVFAQKINADAVIGTWLTASGKAKVQIYKEGNKYNGKIVWLKTPTYDDGTQKVDKHNPDKAKQTTPLMGLNMLKDFIFDGEETWHEGTIYDPENGKTYSCKINYRDAKLDVRGYIGFSFIGRTETWFKVPDIKK